jgi:hypothetical protein
MDFTDEVIREILLIIIIRDLFLSSQHQNLHLNANGSEKSSQRLGYV